MKTTIKITFTLLFASVFMVFASCKKNKNVYAEDLAVTMAENPADDALVGTVIATTEKSYLTYTLLSESVAGALRVDATTGQIFVEDHSKFNFEINPTITATVEASNGKNSDVANVTITLTDVAEVPAAIGDFRDGGVVFWVNPLDIHQGLVCAVSDQSTSSAEWGCWDIFGTVAIAGADGLAIGTGAQNTLDIIAGCSTSGTAAQICNSLVHAGYDDWFLPSRDEMSAIYTNKAAINATSIANGGMAFDETVLYWTSSEFSADPNKAYDFYFFDGVSEGTLKLNSFSVRAVRAF